MPFHFPSSVSSISDVPDAFRSLYEIGADGVSATLNDDLKKKIEPTENLERSLKAERRRADDAERANKAWRDLAQVDSPERLADKIKEIDDNYKSQLDALEKTYAGKLDNADVVKQINAIKTDLEKEHKREIARLTADNTNVTAERNMLRQRIEKHLKETAATSAIAENKGNMKLLKLLVSSSLKIEEEDGDYQVRVIDNDGDVRMDADGKPMTPAAFVAKLKQDDQYAAAFESDGATGSGSRGASIRTPGHAQKKNPFKKGPDFNLTEQMRLQRENPNLAKALQAAAEG